MIVTFWNRLFDPAGSEREMSWPELVELLTAKKMFMGGDIHPGWSPARFEPCERAAENARQVFALCFDFDGDESIEATEPKLRALGRGLMHTTRKHQRDGNGDRFRAVFDISRPLSCFEFTELWKRMAPKMGKIDEAPKDASRFWYLPGCSQYGEFVSSSWDGEPVDVDAWLAKPDPTAQQAAAPAASRVERQDIEERARRYIAKMDAAVSGSGGHQATWDVALVLCRGFGLSGDRAYALLCEYNSRCEPPWKERELKHKIKGALAASKVPLGFLVDAPNEWRTYKSGMPKPPPDDGFASDPPEDWLDNYEPSEEVSTAGAEREPGDDTAERSTRPASEVYGIIDERSLFFEVLSIVQRGAAARGHTTGHYTIDNLLCGLRPGLVSLLAAGTSWGKSSWGIMVADENLKLGVPVLVVSVEDERAMYGKRIVARRSGVNAMRMRDNSCDDADIKAIAREASKTRSEPFFLNAIGRDVEWAANAIRAVCAEREIGVVVCDYVQRFRSKKNFGGDRRAQVTYVAECLSDAGKNGGSHTVLLSQLKRIADQTPTMDDVKESGDLENMADHVLLGYRRKEKSFNGPPLERRFLIVPKNKDGLAFTDLPGILMPFSLVTANFETVDANSRFANAENDAEEALRKYGA
jgi:DnaB-like helicase C terminal domain